MNEEIVLIRRLGRVQARMTQTVQRMVAHINQQDAEIICLRAQLIVSRTCMLWGLRGLPYTDPIRPYRQWSGVIGSGEPAPTRSLANQVICQTGCISHAHHWLSESGQCQRDGEPCGIRIEHGEHHVPAA